MPPLTSDQIIKNLLRDYPVEALEFFNEDIIKKYGYPVRVDFNIQVMTSPRLRRALSLVRGLCSINCRFGY